MATETAHTPAKQLNHRYEGIAKVTGKAKYAAEFSQPFPKADLAYAYIVQASIPNGIIASIDRYAADLGSRFRVVRASHALHKSVPKSIAMGKTPSPAGRGTGITSG